MIHYSKCPVCKTGVAGFAFSAKDHTVSQQSFEIWKCNDCTALFTQDVPGQEAIGAFYASENYISHSDTKEGIINKLYHAVRKRTLASKLHLLQQETGVNHGTMLDVGCGTGAFLHTMQQAGWSATGLEPDENARAKAVNTYSVSVLPSAAIFTLPAAGFDAITMWHVLEHVHQLHEYVAQLKIMLKPKGRLFIAVPNYTSKDAGVYTSNWAAYDVPRHLYHFSPKSMQVLMNQHGLQVIKVKPMWFDSFYVSMLSEQIKNKKGNIIKAAFNGLLSNMKALMNKERCSSVIYIIAHQ